MPARSRASTRDTNIWPGFVDALATLLMVIIFVLMVFIVSQFYLTQALSGRDEALKNLRGEIAELAELLNLERETNAGLRLDVAQLSTELQASIARRDALARQVTRLAGERDRLEEQLAASVQERAGLQQRLGELDNNRTGLDQRLSEVLGERDALLSKLRSVESELAVVKAERDEVNAGLEDAFRVIAADRETIKTQLKDLESLRRDLLALREVRARLEGDIAGLLALKQSLEGDLGETQARLETATLTARERQARIDTILARKDAVEKRLETATLTAEERQARIDALVAETGALRDRSRELLAELAEGRERTLLQQQELAARDIRLAELTADFNRTDGLLDTEREISSAAQEQVALLNRQMRALREQLFALQEAMDALEAVNREQQVEIVDLGSKLNRALATKVQELARFRSEFFGRLREVLSGREGIRIVGDRFVFQSEVLFDSGSAEIGEAGRLQLRRFAEQLKEISARIPPEIDWILQVEGHTDPVPIYTVRFRNNWDLSSARAISVVQTLIAEGIPARHLSATGYGEFQPIDPRTDETGNRRNRRIEMKLTQR